MGGNPGTKTVANNKLPVPLLLWTDWKVGGCSGQKTSYSNSPSLSYCLIKYRSNSERQKKKRTHYKICRVIITTSTKKTWRHWLLTASSWKWFLFFCLFSVFVTSVWQRLPLHECFLSLWSALLNVFCCKIIYKIGGWRRGASDGIPAGFAEVFPFPLFFPFSSFGYSVFSFEPLCFSDVLVSVLFATVCLFGLRRRNLSSSYLSEEK